MKKTVKKILCVVLVAAICAAFAGCAKMNYVTNATIGAINEIKAGTWNQTKEEEGADEDKPVIDELKAGTYGGVDFKTNDDVAKYYVEAYNYTKTLTATYLDKDGKDCTYYKLLGDEDLKVDNILVDGQKNSTINSLVPGIVNGLNQAFTALFLVTTEILSSTTTARVLKKVRKRMRMTTEHQLSQAMIFLHQM